MNIKQALEVPLPRVLEILGCKSKPRKGHRQFFYSPFRNERTPSFSVNLYSNKWHDFGEGIGGDVITLVCNHLKNSGVSYTVSDALRWLNNMTGSYEPIRLSRPVDVAPQEPALAITNNTDLNLVGLIQFMIKRGIPLHIGVKYTKQLRVKNSNTGNSFYAIGFQNEDRGWELRNPSFKACVSPKAPSFVRGIIPKPNDVHVFEGFFDFLSIVSRTVHGKLDGDAIVLNSISCLDQGLAYIKNYGYTSLYSYMDNDATGKKAIKKLSAFVETQEGLVHKPMNRIYSEFKDVNAWHMADLGLKPIIS